MAGERRSSDREVVHGRRRPCLFAMPRSRRQRRAESETTFSLLIMEREITLQSTPIAVAMRGQKKFLLEYFLDAFSANTDSRTPSGLTRWVTWGVRRNAREATIRALNHNNISILCRDARVTVWRRNLLVFILGACYRRKADY